MPGKSSLDHSGVIAVLLQYGARLDAKDICGKTVVHYGAGSHSTEASISLVEMCIDAAEKLSLPTKLVNIQDRFGDVALHEVVMGNRVEVCRFLISRGADVHVKTFATGPGEYGVTTPMKMANPMLCQEMARAFSTESTALKRKEARSDVKEQGCSHCGMIPAKHCRKYCGKCQAVFYCSGDCQQAAWSAGHKQECNQFRLRAAAARIKLDRVHVDIALVDYESMQPRKTPAQPGPGEGWPLPKGIKVNQIFWLKVQTREDNKHLLCYDETRMIRVSIPEGRPAFTELSLKVKNEGVMGCKGHFKASIDTEGDIFVDTSLLKVKPW